MPNKRKVKTRRQRQQMVVDQHEKVRYELHVARDILNNLGCPEIVYTQASGQTDHVPDLLVREHDLFGQELPRHSCCMPSLDMKEFTLCILENKKFFHAPMDGGSDEIRSTLLSVGGVYTIKRDRFAPAKLTHQYITNSLCDELKVHRILDRQKFNMGLKEGSPFQMTIVVLSPLIEMSSEGISGASLKLAVKLEQQLLTENVLPNLGPSCPMEEQQLEQQLPTENVLPNLGQSCPMEDMNCMNLSCVYHNFLD